MIAPAIEETVDRKEATGQLRAQMKGRVSLVGCKDLPSGRPDGVTKAPLDVSFCNPASGNEKGNVENKVGFLRRNLLTPMIQAWPMEKVNEVLLTD
jgi:transposase